MISTDAVSLSDGLLQSIGATNGLSTAGFIFFSPTNLGSINGTLIGYGGVANNTAYFGIAGDLNLASGDQILGIGANFLHLEVGNNATIDSGAKISVEAYGPFAGAGGGAGGAPGSRYIPPTNLSAPGSPGGSGGICTGGAGAPGIDGLAAQFFPNFADWAYPLPGTAGALPIRGFTTPGAGGTDTHGLFGAAQGGKGGAGGPPGVDGTFTSATTDGGMGGDGAPGDKGGDGPAGSPGGMPSGPPQFWFDQGDLYGGAAGGGGEQGGYGLAGGSGGGGGAGGQGGRCLICAVRPLGGSGGTGGDGGNGGAGGPGGSGGGGGGGLEFVVRGTLQLNGIISARGADGVPGTKGTAGSAGTAGQAGQPGSVLQPNGSGGTGGTGGSGGNGGKGGDGGSGGGGAGGTVNLAANQISWGGNVDVTGGTGPLGSAPDGIYRHRSDLDNVYSSPWAPTTARANFYVSLPLSVSTTGVPTDTTPLIDSTFFKPAGGLDVFGFVSSGGLGISPDTTLANHYYTNLAARPSNAVGLVQRENFISADTPNPQLFFINCSGWPLGSPAVAVNRAGDFNYVSPQPLQVRGYTREPMFASGASGGDTLTFLPSLYTWMTYIRPGDSTVTAVLAPYTNAATVSFLTSGSGGNSLQNFWLLDTGLLSVSAIGDFALTTVADRQTNILPVVATARSGGGGTTISLVISNVGNNYSLMSSLPGSDVAFTNLAPAGQPITANWLVGNTNVSGTLPPFILTLASDAGTIMVTGEVDVIGPIPNTSVTGGGNAGTVLLGQNNVLTFSALNNYNLGFLFLPVPASAYELSILSMTVTGPDAAYFALPGPTSGLVPLQYNFLGTANAPWTSPVVFTPDAARSYNATLTVQTDVNAPAGQPGQVFTFPLTGIGANPGVYISQQPANALAQPGATATFTVVAQTFGTVSPLTYQWKRGANLIPNATTATYTIGPVGSADNGATFSCIVTAGSYSTESDQANLAVIDSSAPYPQAVLADQPLLYYRLDELSGSTAYDSSGHGFNGTYSNVGHDPGPAPALGSSASFHGETSEGTIAVPALSGFLPQVTVEAWVNLITWNALPDAFGNIGVSGIYAGDFWQPGSFQVGALNPNQLQVSLFGAAGQGFSERFFIEDDAFTTVAWFHLAYVYGGDSFTYYVNGSVAGIIAVGNAVPVNLTSAHIGAWLGFDGSFYRFLDGQIDEVAVYAAALPPDRIAAHYQAAFAPIAGPLITYTVQGATMQISWSGGSGFLLQHNIDPSDPAGWTDLPAGNFSPITVSLGSAQDFFRLRKL